MMEYGCSMPVNRMFVKSAARKNTSVQLSEVIWNAPDHEHKVLDIRDGYNRDLVHLSAGGSSIKAVCAE